MSSWNFVLSWVEHEESFITSIPDLDGLEPFCQYKFMNLYFIRYGSLYNSGISAEKMYMFLQSFREIQELILEQFFKQF